MSAVAKKKSAKTKPTTDSLAREWDRLVARAFQGVGRLMKRRIELGHYDDDDQRAYEVMYEGLLFIAGRSDAATLARVQAMHGALVGETLAAAVRLVRTAGKHVTSGNTQGGGASFLLHSLAKMVSTPLAKRLIALSESPTTRDEVTEILKRWRARPKNTRRGELGEHGVLAAVLKLSGDKRKTKTIRDKLHGEFRPRAQTESRL